MPGTLKEINIKADMPTADDAIKRITYQLHNSKKLGVYSTEDHPRLRLDRFGRKDKSARPKIFRRSKKTRRYKRVCTR